MHIRHVSGRSFSVRQKRIDIRLEVQTVFRLLDLSSNLVIISLRKAH